MANPNMYVSPDDSDLLAPKPAGELVGVHPLTLKRWEKAGRITPLRTPTGHRRYRRADLLALLTTRGAA